MPQDPFSHSRRLLEPVVRKVSRDQAVGNGEWLDLVLAVMDDCRAALDEAARRAEAADTALLAQTRMETQQAIHAFERRVEGGPRRKPKE